MSFGSHVDTPTADASHEEKGSVGSELHGSYLHIREEAVNTRGREEKDA